MGRDNEMIADILLAIKKTRPDLKLHGFGVKLKQVRHGLISSLLYSADSACGSYSTCGLPSHRRADLAIKYQTKVLRTPIALDFNQYQALQPIEDPDTVEKIRDEELLRNWSELNLDIWDEEAILECVWGN